MAAKLLVFLIFVYFGCISGVPCESSPSNDRIVGGLPMIIAEAPYQVSVQRLSGKVRIHHCGGSIINDLWILTAAHCLHYYPNQPHFIRAGATHRSRGGKLYNVIDALEHPEIDAALLKVDFPIIYSNKIKPIRLPALDDIYVPPGTDTLVTGWGLTHNPDESPDTLRGVHVPVIDQKVCKDAYNAGGFDIRPHEICAGDFENGGKDSCNKDSGGPLVRFDSHTKEAIQIGIVSWGKGCALLKFPGVYARITAVREWIDQHTPDD